MAALTRARAALVEIARFTVFLPMAARAALLTAKVALAVAF